MPLTNAVGLDARVEPDAAVSLLFGAVEVPLVPVGPEYCFVEVVELSLDLLDTDDVAFCLASQPRKPLAHAERMPLRLSVITRNMLNSVGKAGPIRKRNVPRLPPGVHRVCNRERSAAFRQLCDEIRPHDAVFLQCGTVQHRREARPACGILRKSHRELGHRLRHAVRARLQGHPARGRGLDGARPRGPRRALRVQPQGSEGSRRGRHRSSARRSRDEC